MIERQIDRSAWILPWAAGVVDSDGCITIKRSKPDKYGARYYRLMIVVAQCGDHEIAPVIKLLRDTFCGSVQHREGKGHRRAMWHWAVASMNAEIVLRKIQPYLIGKQDQALAALEYRDTAMGMGSVKKALAESYYHKLRGFKNYTRHDEVPGTQTGETTP